MRRGQEIREEMGPDQGFSKQELMDAAALSAKVFDQIRKASRVRGPSHGGLRWMFPFEDVIIMIHRAESGTFSERGAPAALAWRELLLERGVTVPKK